MKKILLTASVVIAGLFQSNAQCVIAPTCTPSSATGYCAAPSASTNLPAGVTSVAYSTNIQFSLGTSAAGGAFAVNGATITATSGLPTGLTASYNPANGIVAAGGNACLLISGTPTGATGTYTFSATFSVQITPLGTTTPQYQVVTANWYLPINASSVGIAQLTQQPNVMLMSPNPAKSELNVTTDFHIAKLTVIDALGKVVITQDVNYANQTTLDIRNLEKGLYFLQATEGSKMITKKFIKD
jgi:hypothetical protein